jgi:CheY-like chemotaxis protein
VPRDSFGNGLGIDGELFLPASRTWASPHLIDSRNRFLRTGRFRLDASTKKQPMALRLLIVDDNRDSADSLALLLEHQGFEVRVAYDGELAIEAALSFHPDVLIVDLVMPVLDGFQVAKKLRAIPEFREATFVALSGYSDQSHFDEASQAQFDEYVVKPPDVKLVMAILSEVSERVGN